MEIDRIVGLCLSGPKCVTEQPTFRPRAMQACEGFMDLVTNVPMESQLGSFPNESNSHVNMQHELVT